MSSLNTVTAIEAEISKLQLLKVSITQNAIKQAVVEVIEKFSLQAIQSQLENLCINLNGQSEIYVHQLNELFSVGYQEAAELMLDAGLFIRHHYWSGSDDFDMKIPDQEYVDCSQPADGQYADYEYGFKISKEKFFSHIYYTYSVTPVFNEILKRHLASVQ